MSSKTGQEKMEKTDTLEVEKEIMKNSSTSEPDNDKSRIIMLVDETGSMAHNKEVTISSYNEWLDSNRKTKEEDEDHFPRFTLVKFNTTCRMSEYESIEQAPCLTSSNYKPNHRTALYDAIGETLTHYQNEKDNIMVIITDGQENCSRKFRQHQIRELIQKHTDEKGWIFHYLGANQDAWSVGRRIGIMKPEFCNSYTADEDGFEHVYQQQAVQTKVYRQYQSAKKKRKYVESLMDLDVPTIEKKDKKRKEEDIESASLVVMTGEEQEKEKGGETGKEPEKTIDDFVDQAKDILRKHKILPEEKISQLKRWEAIDIVRQIATAKEDEKEGETGKEPEKKTEKISPYELMAMSPSTKDD